MLALSTLFSVSRIEAASARAFYQQQGYQEVDPTGHKATCYALHTGGEMVAAAVVMHDIQTPLWGMSGRHQVVSSVLVDPDFRGKGIGRSLMQSIMKAHPDNYLSVLVTNGKARSLYESLGYTEVTTATAQERIIMKSPIETATDLFAPAKTRHPGFGYVKLNLHPRHATRLYDELVRIGIKDAILPHKLHVTLVYDPDNPLRMSPKQDRTRGYRAYITEYDMMGAPSSDWRSVAFHLKAPAIEHRHKELLKMGFSHSYPDYRCHVSLKYKPTKRDLSIIAENFNHLCDLFSEGLLFEREEWEPISESD